MIDYGEHLIGADDDLIGGGDDHGEDLYSLPLTGAVVMIVYLIGAE